MMVITAPFLVFPLLVAGLALPYFLLTMAFSQERRAWAARRSILCIGEVVGLLAGLLGVDAVRDARFAAATVRAKPLIRAIEAHRKETGEWPESLETLVPTRLREIPGTGMMAYPKFNYQRAKEGDERFKNYHLVISCPSGGINFDVFVYWPEKVYPDFMYGGSVERIGDWAYVHE